MDFTSQSTRSVLDLLDKQPDNHDVLRELAHRSQDPVTEGEILEQLAPHTQSAEVHPSFSFHKEPVWQNCTKSQTCYPVAIHTPKSLDDLIQEVNSARQAKQHVRVVGSGHSFSDVCLTEGVILDPHGMGRVLKVDSTMLKNPSSAANLFSVESGITIANLNKALHANKKALINMGAYDGQTVAGAISTGTHGTGIMLGNIASSVRSLVLVSSSGTVYQVEPSNGITDAAIFKTDNITLKQDDAWFNTTLNAMGCTGLIYSYTLEVQDAFYLQEFRTLHSWEELKDGLSAGSASKILAEHRGYEIDINPYTLPGANTHACIQILHNDIQAISQSGTRGFKNWLGGLLSIFPGAQWLLTHYLNKYPSVIPKTLVTALNTLVTPPWEKNGYIDKSFRVMNVGTVVNKIKAYAIELSFPCDNTLVAQIDKLLAFLNTCASEKSWYMTGPLNLRFVAASQAFLAPQSGRPTCMVELDMLVGINHADDLFKAVKAEMCTPKSGARMHWGLDIDTITHEDVVKWYPDFDKWLAVYKELNREGMWNGPLTERLGISV